MLREQEKACIFRSGARADQKVFLIQLKAAEFAVNYITSKINCERSRINKF